MGSWGNVIIGSLDLTVLETAEFLGFLCKAVSRNRALEFTKNGAKHKKHPDRNALLVRVVRGE